MSRQATWRRWSTDKGHRGLAQCSGGRWEGRPLRHRRFATVCARPSLVRAEFPDIARYVNRPAKLPHGKWPGRGEAPNPPHTGITVELPLLRVIVLGEVVLAKYAG